MLETFERGKKYQVAKKWSAKYSADLANVRDSLNVGELLRFRGPNWDGAHFLDAEGKLVILPVKVAFRIMAQPNTASTGQEPSSVSESKGTGGSCQ
ncbi:MAG: hypothetical protein WC714_28735 [Candidatus Obscuribacterales bacterium]|jgi:hypothetical protein